MFNLSRRSFLRHSLTSSLLAVGGLSFPSWMPRVAFGPPDRSPRGDVLVVIFLRGGHDALNIIVPHAAPGADQYYAKRPNLKIAQPNPSNPAAAIDLDGQFGFNPVLRPLMDLWQDGHLAAVHAVGSPDPTHSHFDAMDYMERGTPGEKQVPSGWLARHLSSLATENQSPFRAVGMGTAVQAALRGPVPAVALQSIANFHIDPRQQEIEIARIQATLSSLYQGATPLEIEGQETFEAMDILKSIAARGEYRPANGATYPTGGFGDAMKTVAQLIKEDIGLEVACVDQGGYDTHSGQGTTDTANPNTLPGLLNVLQAGMLAFYTDLQDYMKNVTVVTMTEFGRRLAENTSGGGGTDHGHGSAMFVMGGGVNGGQVYTDWPGLAPQQLYGPGDLAITTDYRDVLGEALRVRLGNPHLDQVFPGYDSFKTLNLFKPRTINFRAFLPYIQAAAR